MNLRKVSALAGVAVLTFAACSTPGCHDGPDRLSGRQRRHGWAHADRAEAGR